MPFGNATLYDVNQYAQRIISTPGKQDGLAWQNADGTWGGPIGENIARAIEQGYTSSLAALPWLFLQNPEGARPGGAARRNGFCGEGYHDRRLCPGRCTG